MSLYQVILLDQPSGGSKRCDIGVLVPSHAGDQIVDVFKAAAQLNCDGGRFQLAFVGQPRAIT